MQAWYHCRHRSLYLRKLSVSDMPSVVRHKSTWVVVLASGGECCSSNSMLTAANTASGPLSIPVSTTPKYSAWTWPSKSFKVMLAGATTTYIKPITLDSRKVQKLHFFKRTIMTVYYGLDLRQYFTWFMKCLLLCAARVFMHNPLSSLW